MSAVQLVLAVLLLVVGGAFLLRWMQDRHSAEWDTETNSSNKQKSKRGRKTSTRGASSRGTDLTSEHNDAAFSSASASDADEYTNSGDGGVVARGHRPGGLRRRHQRGGGAGGHAHDNANTTHDLGEDADDDAYDENGVKLTRLQRKKLAKEREKEERRQAQEAALEAQRQRADLSDLRNAEAAMKEEEMKAAEEAALRELRAEKQKADNEEYAKWVGHIGVEERGEWGDEVRKRQERVQRFLLDRAANVRARAQQPQPPQQQQTSASTTEGASVSHSNSGSSGCGESAFDAKAKKPTSDEVDGEIESGHVLVLQSAARHLKVSVEELVNTIEQMTRDGQVDGVFDDRGKYVFIAPEHFPQLAQFIRLRGRVSVQEFTRECNRIIMQS